MADLRGNVKLEEPAGLGSWCGWKKHPCTGPTAHYRGLPPGGRVGGGRLDLGAQNKLSAMRSPSGKNVCIASMQSLLLHPLRWPGNCTANPTRAGSMRRWFHVSGPSLTKKE